MAVICPKHRVPACDCGCYTIARHHGCPHCKGTKVLLVDNGFHTTNCFHCNPAPEKQPWNQGGPKK